MGRLLLLFIIVPAAELVLLIEIGRRIGTLPTLGLIVVTGILGAGLARRQGLGVIRKIQAETAAGHMPAGALVDGVMILIAAAVLITPGVLTDALGFLCLIPFTRKWIKAGVWRWLKRAVQDGRVQVSLRVDGYAGPSPPPGSRTTPGKPGQVRRPPDRRLEE
jgi:UPF0716 protein FxsA